VVKGLVALVIEGGVDPRDDIMRLAVLFHSARMLDMDAARVFAEVARLSGNPSLADEIRTFPGRPPAIRDLASLSLSVRLKSGPGGLGYEYMPSKRRRWPWRWFR
jgi:hypothetical protein